MVRNSALWCIRQKRRVLRWGWGVCEAVLDFFYFGKFLGRVIRAPLHGEVRDVEATDYRVLWKLGPWFQFCSSDVVVDIGAGNGRVLCWWARISSGCRMVGIELVPSVAKALSHRVRGYSRVTILVGDAVENLPEDTTFLYLYNPFGEQTMRRLQVKLENGLNSGRTYRILYCGGEHSHVFEASRRWVVRELPLDVPASSQPVVWITPA